MMTKFRLFALAFAATPLLISCGSSDSDSNDTNKNKTPANNTVEALYGNWHAPDCVMVRPDPAVDKFIDQREFIVLNNNNLKIIKQSYASTDRTCSGKTDQKVEEFSYTDDGKAVDADTGLEVRKISLERVGAPNKWLVYVSPQLNRTMVTFGSTTHPLKMSWEKIYFKEGASQAYVAGEKNINIISHSALSFKSGDTEATDPNAALDGSTSAWSPSTKYLAGEYRDRNVWLRTFDGGDFNYVHDAGAVDLDKVSTIPATWLRKVSNGDKQPEPIPAMRKNHSYVIKLHDSGHAKFRVLNTPDPKAMGWPLLIEYELMK